MVAPAGSATNMFEDITRSLGCAQLTPALAQMQILAMQGLLDARFGGNRSAMDATQNHDEKVQPLGNIDVPIPKPSRSAVNDEAPADVVGTGSNVDGDAVVPFDPAAADAEMRKAMAARADGIEKKRLKKRPASAAKAPKKLHVAGSGESKRPAASTSRKRDSTGAYKRPASAGMPPPKIYRPPSTFTWVHAEDSHRNRNTYQSMWYSRQKVIMKSLKWGDAAIKTELSRVFKVAGQEWDKHVK